MPRENTIQDPPFFSLGDDTFEWHKKEWKWVQLIKAAHDSGNDSFYHTKFKILGQKSYLRGLSREQQAVVDEARPEGTVNYLHTGDPVKVALNIVKVVAIDPPIAKVTSLIAYLNRVTSCKRSKNKKMSVFVTRFWEIAADHLQNAHASSSSKISKVLAIAMMNNASLDESTLTYLKLQPISLAENQSDKKTNDEKVLLQF